jgi:hypothetical protein
MNFFNTQQPSAHGSFFFRGVSEYGNRGYSTQQTHQSANAFQNLYQGNGFGSYSPWNGFNSNPHFMFALTNMIQSLIYQLQALQQQYPQLPSQPSCCPQQNPYAIEDGEYRSYDGSGNNPFNNKGATDSLFMRRFEQDPDRGIGGVTEANLPNAREISNAVAAQDGNTENVKGLSDMFWVFGQFLDHDINLTLEDEGGETANIAVPEGDPYFDPFGTGEQEIHFTRSNVTLDANGQRQQANSITAFIDGSNIYGSTEEMANQMRAFEGGLMLVEGDNNFLPRGEDGFYMAGDIRANENAALTSMHTIWVWEHNRVATELGEQHPDWDDETLYQEARKYVTAEFQAVTYNEFIPAMLGEDALSDYCGYNPNTNPQISETFATAAYRFGHTMLSGEIQRVDENGNEIEEGHLSLRDAFFNPDNVEEAGIEPILRGIAGHTAQAVDPMVVDDVRNFLFGPPGSGGLDLASLNIQRGRDHEIPAYNDLREALGLHRIESFDDPIFKGDFGERLASVYDSPDDIDAWVGGLAEENYGDSALGVTMSLILKDQFERLRDGDRFYYENQYSGADLAELNNLTLSDIIKRNTDIENIQDNVFYSGA